MSFPFCSLLLVFLFPFLRLIVRITVLLLLNVKEQPAAAAAAVTIDALAKRRGRYLNVVDTFNTCHIVAFNRTCFTVSLFLSPFWR